ncbi:DUF413 domain-containing protein [Gallaecimonas sp. GXIMD4217]|uniref:DUF413 domain-containing protein n=1 Tax=Gallaecimonas sp. GXIMD4217 TaxID=3131927 RepID=UPI00311B437E
MNFPRGFQRSGDFTIGEAKLLIEQGRAMQELASGLREAMTEQEQHFLMVCRGEAQPASPQEKVWLKYQGRISQRRHMHTMCGVVSKQAVTEVVASEED